MVKDLYDFKEELSKPGIFFCLSGPISQNLVAEIGTTLEQKMNLEDASKSTVLRVFSMVVENAQNIIHYSAEKYLMVEEPKDKEENKDLSLGIIAVGYDDGHYFVLGGNMVKNDQVERLSSKLARLRDMNREELKKYYRKKRKNGPDQWSKGAGLGFIDMAKKSARPFEYNFRKIDDQFSFFSLKTII